MTQKILALALVLAAAAADSDCVDSPTWLKAGSGVDKNGDPTDCSWVAKYASPRCQAKGVDKTLARYSCPAACGTTCDDDVTWHKKGNPSKDCAWVSRMFPERCSVVGEDDTQARDSCTSACPRCRSAGVHMVQGFYKDDNCQVRHEELADMMVPYEPCFEGDPSYDAGVCEPLPPGDFDGPGPGDYIIHSGLLTCGPGNCQATVGWWVGTETCDDAADTRYEELTFTFEPGATDGDYSRCLKMTESEGLDECSVGGQVCSRNLRYYKEPDDREPWYVHEYCPCEPE